MHQSSQYLDTTLSRWSYGNAVKEYDLRWYGIPL